MGSRIYLRPYDVSKGESAGFVIQLVYADMVHAYIGGAEVFIIPGHLYAVYMGHEIPFSDRPKALMVDLLADVVYRSVLCQREYGDLAVMVAGNKEKSVLVVSGNITSAHTVYAGFVQKGELAVRFYLIGMYSLIGYGIQEAAAMGYGYV